MTIQFTVHVISMYWYKFNSLHELDCQISSKSNKYKFWDVVCLHYLCSKDNNYYNNCWAFFQDLLIFLMEKPIAAVILCLFVIKMSISSLFSLLFQWHAQNQLASVNFSSLKNTGNVGIATEKNLMSSTYITSKFDIEIWT